MARPKYSENDLLATEKIFASFWELLSDIPYSEISVVALCRNAGLNKNTFYYHFESLDDMVVSLINASLDEQFAIWILQTALNDNVQIPDEFSAKREQFEHLCLLVGNHSHPLLLSTFKEAILKVWLPLLNRTGTEMSFDFYIAATFAINGILSVLALNNKENGFSFITVPELLKRDFIKGMLKSIAGL